MKYKRNNGEGLKIIGVASACPKDDTSCLQTRVAKPSLLLDRLDYPDKAQCALEILRYCLGPAKMMYLLRFKTHSKTVVKDLQLFDDFQRETL